MISSAHIRLLDDFTVAQIAAGEVIERPVSVVKELVENSLDAGAGRISVDLADGGRAAISVKDDGSGISASSLRLALERHATSKLVAAQDLFAVSTLGFRGEGLSSVAAAGHVEITSRPAGQEFGAKVQAHGTFIGEVETVAAPPGTKVVVRDIFSALPARREFLKSSAAELSRISAFLSRLALGWPQVGFSLTNDGRQVWALPATASRVDRLEAVFGRSARGTLLEVVPDHDGQSEQVRGHISAPLCDRASRDHQVFFVNGRLVRSGALAAAWLAGHASASASGRYPYGIILIDMPPQDVDVNVHPTKFEVRFARPAQAFDAVRRAVVKALRSAPSGGAAASRVAWPESRSASPAEFTPSAQDSQPPLSLLNAAPQAMRSLGQVDRTYVLLTDGAQLIVLDQHAAHERIAYEAIVASDGHVHGASPLLFPTVVELTPDRAAVFHQFETELVQAGVVVEKFGEWTYRICAVPSGYDQRRFDLEQMLDDLAAAEALRAGLGRRELLLATIACHSVTRAHEPLSAAEQLSLYERLLGCAQPQTCPHGRPTILRLDSGWFAKAFKRP
ncbi:MAG: DNA mismatch repair endonuclease MutL [Candidatus Eremiobacteraeota bacterium]|nr:DNA mismatch repair endonuclease MutL [Candidatus Eremiobacteraeota bacterium]